jgi:hypothetical protein
VLGGVAAHYCYDHVTIDGLVFPTWRRVARHMPEGPLLSGRTSFILDYTNLSGPPMIGTPARIQPGFLRRASRWPFGSTREGVEVALIRTHKATRCGSLAGKVSNLSRALSEVTSPLASASD